MTLTDPPVPATGRQRKLRNPLIAAVLAIAVVAGYLAYPAAKGDDPADAALNNPIRILLVGDSITSGRNPAPEFAGPGASLEPPTYRAPLFDKLDAVQGLNFDFVGSQSGIDNGAANIADPRLGDPDHEGHNGWRLDEMVNGHASQTSFGNITLWIEEEDPDILVLYGGANDFAQGEEASQVFSEFIEAIEVIRAAKSDIRLVITNNHPHENNAARNAKINTLNPFIPMLEQYSTAESPIITVDIHTGYPSHPDDNGSHPGPQGQEFFAQQIFEALTNSGFLVDDTPAPSIDNTNKSGDRGVRGLEVDITGEDIYPNFTADFGDGVHVTKTVWDNETPNNSKITVTVDIDLWAATGTRDITITNSDGDSAVCSDCFTVNSSQVQPPLKIMILGGETTSGRRWVPQEAPTYRGDLFTLIDGDDVEFDFVGSQSGVDSGDLQALPLTELGDLDHEGHREFHIQELINGKSGEGDQGQLSEWLDESDPDVVVLYAGQQDVRGGQANNGVLNELKQVVDQLRAHNPSVRIVVTNVNNHKSSTSINAEIDSYNGYFASNAAALLTDTAMSPLALADISNLTIGAPGDLWSGTYPNSSGNTKIATAIYNALNSKNMLDPVPQPPGAATNPAVTGDLGEITVTWGGAELSGFELTPITGYDVTLNPGNITQNLGAAARQATFTGLSSTVTYTVTVTSKNAVGNGPSVQASGSPTGSFETDGYWMVQSNGTVHAFGGAANLGQPVGQLGGATAVAIASHPNGGGYWVLASNGTVYAYGTAQVYAPNNTAVLSPGEEITTIAPHPDGNGYWVFTTLGRAIAHGSAGHFGDLITLGILPAEPVIASSPTASGNGYYMVGGDGGVFNFGDAVYKGSVPEVLGPGVLPNKPVVGVVPTPTGDGYWMIASDGGVFAFNAPFRGSLPGLNVVPVHPVTGMVPFGTDGYIAVGEDGGLFAFSAPYFGSLPDPDVGPFFVVDDVVAVTPSVGLVG